MLQSSIDKTNQIKALIKEQGITARDACKQVGISNATYCKVNKELAKAKKKTPKTKLNVTDLPAPAFEPGKLFLIYGSPAMLADFARSIQ